MLPMNEEYLYVAETMMSRIYHGVFKDSEVTFVLRGSQHL